MFNFHQFLFTSKIMSELNYAIYYLKITTISIQDYKNSIVNNFYDSCPIELKLSEICFELESKTIPILKFFTSITVFLCSLGQF